MIIEEVVNNKLNKNNLLFSFEKLLNDENFRNNQISQVKKNLFQHNPKF